MYEITYIEDNNIYIKRLKLDKDYGDLSPIILDCILTLYNGVAYLNTSRESDAQLVVESIRIVQSTVNDIDTEFILTISLYTKKFEDNEEFATFIGNTLFQYSLSDPMTSISLRSEWIHTGLHMSITPPLLQFAITNVNTSQEYIYVEKLVNSCIHSYNKNRSLDPSIMHLLSHNHERNFSTFTVMLQNLIVSEIYTDEFYQTSHYDIFFERILTPKFNNTNHKVLRRTIPTFENIYRYSFFILK